MKQRIETIFTKVNHQAELLNEKASAEVLAKMTLFQQIKVLDKQLRGIYCGIWDIKTYWQLWTRSDGARYKELDAMHCNQSNYDRLVKRYPRAFKKVFPTRQSVLDYAWQSIIDRPRVKHIGLVSGPHGSDDYHEAVRSQGIIYINRPWGIEYASPSILRNSSVWHLKKHETT